MSLLQSVSGSHYVVLGALIASLAFIQSLFGVGLLIFGTPVLLLAGATFDEVLSILLPASLSVSMLQLACDGRPPTGQVGAYFKFTLPALGLGLLLALFARLPGLDFMICALLVIAALMRAVPAYRDWLLAFAKRFSRSLLITIGLVHGMTNMGGSLLEAYVSSREIEKLSIRQSIASGYALLAGSQLIVLALVGRLHLTDASLLAVAVAASIFVTFGRRTFAAIDKARYRLLVSVLMILAACALIAKRVAA